MSNHLVSGLHILVVILFGAIFIPSILNQPVSEEPAARLYYIFFSLVAIAIGTFGALFPKRFNEGNQRSFQKLYDKTKIPLFRLQAEGTGKPYMVPFARSMGTLFVVIGIILLIKNLSSFVGM